MAEVGSEPEPTTSPYVEKQGIFEFIVLSFNGVLPGAVGYEREKDRLMIGFRYGNKTAPSWFKDKSVPVTDVTAYDFLTDPRTGRREGQVLDPHGSSYTDLERGISDFSDLPPLFVWKQGMWLSKAVWEPEFDVDTLPVHVKNSVRTLIAEGWDGKKIPPDIFTLFVVSGEGTTGNNLYRVYKLPAEVCGRDDPHHPLMWPEKLKKPSYESYAYKGESWRESAQTPPKNYAYGLPTTTKAIGTTTTTVKPFSPPAGTRMRCPDCGHWYSYQDLIQHSAMCGDTEKQDWAIMCHSDCGCSNLDEASTPKPGFPRVVAKQEKEEGAALDTGGSEQGPS